MRCAICGNEDLSKIEVVIEAKKVTFTTFKADDLKNPIKWDDNLLGSAFKSIASAKCTKCGNELDHDELEELSEKINVLVF